MCVWRHTVFSTQHEHNLARPMLSPPRPLLSSKEGPVAPRPLFNLWTRAVFQAVRRDVRVGAVLDGLPQSSSSGRLQHRRVQEDVGGYPTSADHRCRSRCGMPHVRRGRLRWDRSVHAVLTCTISRAPEPSDGHDLEGRKLGANACKFTFHWSPRGGGQCVWVRSKSQMGHTLTADHCAASLV